MKGWPAISRTPEEITYLLGDEEVNKFGWILGPHHLCLDVDEHGKGSGTASLVSLSQDLGIDLEAHCQALVITPSGGKHLLWLKPEAAHVRSISTSHPALDIMDREAHVPAGWKREGKGGPALEWIGNSGGKVNTAAEPGQLRNAHDLGIVPGSDTSGGQTASSAEEASSNLMHALAAVDSQRLRSGLCG